MAETQSAMCPYEAEDWFESARQTFAHAYKVCCNTPEVLLDNQKGSSSPEQCSPSPVLGTKSPFLLIHHHEPSPIPLSHPLSCQAILTYCLSSHAYWYLQFYLL